MATLPLPSPHPLPSHRHIPTTATKDVWLNPTLPRDHPRRRKPPHYVDRSVNLPALLSALSAARTATDMAAALSPYLPPASPRPVLSLRFLCTLLSRLPDPRRALALLDLLAPLLPAPSLLLPYNLVLRAAARAGHLRLASGLLLEMRASPGLSPDAFSYSTLLAALTRAGHLDHALTFLPLMEADAVAPDLVLFSNLIHLALRLGDAPKALALFSRLQAAGLRPDLKAYNAAIAAYCKSNLLRDAKRLLLHDMPAVGVAPDADSYSAVLAALSRRGRYLAAVSLFSHMRAVARVEPDLTAFNIALHAYGQLDLAREADRLFWSMRRAGVPPGVVTYNTMLRVYGDAGLFGEAAHLFRLMCRASDAATGGSSVKPNVVTYNTMIAIHGKAVEHEKAGSLVQEMQAKGIQPNAITYSTMISIWAKAGKLDRAAKLFGKLREAGAEIDPVLYQTMVVAYERAGLVSQAKRLLQDLKHPEGVPKATAVKILANAGRVEEAAWLFRRAAEAGEVRDASVHRAMMELFAKNRRHRDVVEAFDEMRKAGFFPDSETIAVAMNAYGKLRDFGRAAALYQEMRDEGCVFSDRVHFQMLSLLGAEGDFEALEALLGTLCGDPSIDKRELRLVAAGVYERANKPYEASRLMSQIRDSDASGVQEI